MNINMTDNRSRWAVLLFVLASVLLIYLSRATYYGLWFDEAIEYFYSKYLTGFVPGGGPTQNMYERICSTYQPPLYNCLMYVWLRLFDSEFGFRLAGILTTLLGGVGFFLALNKITDCRWAAGGTWMYLLSTSVAYYALECAEYNLVLCCLCWCICFYVFSITETKTKHIAAFFIFACLSAYSQYGAVFVIVPLYISLAAELLKRKEKVKVFCVSSIAAAFLALLLTVYFLVPQLMHQGTVTVSHVPRFACGNIFVDFIYSPIKQLEANFGTYQYVPVLLLLAVALLNYRRDGLLYKFSCISLCCWLSYYVMVACSLYVYNFWSPSLGTQNIGSRYGVILDPLILITGCYGVYVCVSHIGRGRKRVNAVICVFSVLLAVSHVFLGAKFLYDGLIDNNCVAVAKTKFGKDDIRSISKLWYEKGAMNSVTLVHYWSYPIFQFYLIHNNSYSEEMQNHIMATDEWIIMCDYETMKKACEQMRIFDLGECYFITPVKANYHHFDGKYYDFYNAFINVMEDNGYCIYKLYEGESALVHAVKK